jgi:hypothetical protein
VPGSVHVGFVVDIVALGQIDLISLLIYNLKDEQQSCFLAAVQKQSQPIDMSNSEQHAALMW